MIILRTINEHKIEREDIVHCNMSIVDRNTSEGKTIFIYILSII